MEKNIIFFDLDGTLTDPMLGITRSVQHALKAYGVIEEDLTRLIPFIGPPLKDNFMIFQRNRPKRPFTNTGNILRPAVCLKTGCMREYRRCLAS